MRSLLVVLALLVSTAAHAQRQPPWVFAIPGGSGSLAALFYECVTHHTAQGFSVQRAAAMCLVAGAISDSRAQGVGFPVEVIAGEKGPSAIACDTLGVDPALGQIVVRSPDGDREPDHRSPFRPGSYNDTLYQWAINLRGRLSVDLAREAEALRQLAATMSDPNQKKELETKAADLDDLSDLFFKDHLFGEVARYLEAEKPSPPGDYPIPNPDAPTPAHVSPGATAGCNAINAFLNECTLASWQTAPCELFLSRLNGCADPTIARVDPDAEQACRNTKVSAQEIEEVAFLACSEKTKPVPGQDPCSGELGVGVAFEFRYGDDNPNAPICANPFALVTPETCVGTFKIVLARQQTIQDVIEAARRFGGPVVVLPLGGNNPWDNGNNCASDPRCK